MGLGKVAVLGLGQIGQNIILNLRDDGFDVICYSIFKKERVSFQKKMVLKDKLFFPETLNDLCDLFGNTQKRIILSIKAGDPIDRLLVILIPLLKENDIIIDSGNSFFKDSENREKILKEKNIIFLDVGISGGIKGARYGASLMIGGNTEGFYRCEDILQSLSANYKGELCYELLGPSGVGHFIKMVHNGIEYALMQLIAEYYFLLKNIFNLSSDEVLKYFKKLNRHKNKSYLLQITENILKTRECNSSQLVIDMIKDSAYQKGTGKWASLTALELGSPASLIILATIEREISSSMLRKYKLPKNVGKRNNKYQIEKYFYKIEESFYLCFLVAYSQGFDIIQKAVNVYGWDLNPSTVAGIWRKGCIIQSSLIIEIHNVLKQKSPDLPLISFASWGIVEKQKSLIDIVRLVMDNIDPLPLICNVHQYLNSIQSNKMPTNLIQAQRDYFGRHGFERIDKDGLFHQQWKEK